LRRAAVKARLLAAAYPIHGLSKRDLRSRVGAIGKHSSQNQNRTTHPGIGRRTFLLSAISAGAAAFVGKASGAGASVLGNPQADADARALRFVWISDTHLGLRPADGRFAQRAMRAVREIESLDPPPDFIIFGGDLALNGDPAELAFGAGMLRALRAKTWFIPGEHDWYLDMGATWRAGFGAAPWTFDHKGVRFIGLDTVSRALDFWTPRRLTPKQRMAEVAWLDGGLGDGWAAVGLEQIDFLSAALSGWPKHRPVVIFSHNPLYDDHPRWNLWVRDWRTVHEVLRPYSDMMNIHGHGHRIAFHETGEMQFIGMPALAWEWPRPPSAASASPTAGVRFEASQGGTGWAEIVFPAELQISAEAERGPRLVHFHRANETQHGGAHYIPNAP
jgi:3',5'-cyclic-AMP phosphodiesterase